MNDNSWVSIAVVNSDILWGSAINRRCLKMCSCQLFLLHSGHCYSSAESKEATIVYSNLVEANSFTIF